MNKATYMISQRRCKAKMLKISILPFKEGCGKGLKNEVGNIIAKEMHVDNM